LAQVQQQISTTLAVAQPKDNPAVWATAQGQKIDVDGLASVTQSLNRASSISDVALSAGQSVVDLLNQMKQDALSAQDPQLDPASRGASTTTSPACWRGSPRPCPTPRSTAPICLMARAETCASWPPPTPPSR
jgi:hypothetical protein